MQKRSISIRALSILSVILLIVLLTPLFISAFYNRPINDDLVQPYPAKKAYEETGSLFQTLIASIRETNRIWHAYSGIFFSMFLSVLAPYAIDYRLGFIHPIILCVFLVFACFKLAKCIHLVNKEIPSSYLHLIAAILCITFITVMPDITEGLYWYSGAMNYLFIFTISIILFSSLLQSVFNQNGTHSRQFLLIILYCLGFFLIGGGNWISSTSSIVVYGFLSIFLIYKKKPMIYLIPYLFLIAGFILALIAPGNANRQVMVGDPPSIIEAFVLSFFNALQFCFSDGRFYLFPLLLLPVFARLSHYMPKLPKLFWLFPIGSVCILASCFFPMLYTGYAIEPRHENTIFFIFTILLFINEMLLICWISQYLSARYQQGDHFALSKTLAYCTAFLLLVISAFETTFSLSPIRFTSEYVPIKASVHLLMGYTKNYTTSYDDIIDRLQSAESDEVILDFVPHSPIVGTPGLQWFDDYWVNSAFVDFYTDKDIRLKTK